MGQVPHHRAIIVPLRKSTLIAKIRSNCNMLNRLPLESMSVDDIVKHLEQSNCESLKKILQFR